MITVKTVTDLLDKLYVLGSIERAIQLPHIGTYTVAEHSFRGAVLAWLLCQESWCSNTEITQAVFGFLVHDLPEAWTGDIPYHTKKKYLPDWEEWESEIIEDEILGLAPLKPTKAEKMLKKSIFQHDFNEKAKTIIRLADILEFAHWLIRQYDLGNRHRNLYKCISESITIITTTNPNFLKSRIAQDISQQCANILAEEIAKNEK